MQSGIYVIKAKGPFGKAYIGQAQDIFERWARHKNMLRSNTHHNLPLQNYYNKYSSESLEYKVLEYCSIDELTVKEQFWIDFHKKNGGVFNIVDAAENPMRNEASRMKVSLAMRGNKNGLGVIKSEETRRKLSEANKGKTLSEEHKQKLSQAHTGKTLSPEHVEKLRGRTHSEETKRKMSESRCNTVFQFISPEGLTVMVQNLKNFCIENGLCASHMWSVAAGRRKSHKGWKACYPSA